MTTTRNRPTTGSTMTMAKETAPLPATGTLACPHCKKLFAPAVDHTQPPRLQGAKCPNCKLFVPERIVAAAAGA